MSGLQKVLIVDDRVENLIALENTLSKLDVEIVRATNGNDALAAFIDHEFAVAILDVQMPDMDGYELAEHLRGSGTLPILPILFVTASYYDELHMFKGYEAGGVDFIFKPIAPEVLISKVKVFLELDRHRKMLESIVVERTAGIRHLNDVLRGIRNVNQLIVREKDPDRLIRQACELLVEARSFRYAWIALTDEMSNDVRFAHAALPDDDFNQLKNLFKEGRKPECCRSAMGKGRTIVTKSKNDICDDCPLRKFLSETMAMTACLVHEGRNYGYINVLLPEGFDVNDEEISLFDESVGDISLALHGIEVEQARRTSEKTLAAIFDNATDGILLADAATRRFVEGNDAICEMLGYSRDELLALSVDNIHPPDDLPYVASQFEKQAKGEITLAPDIPMKRKDGGVFFANVNSAPLEVDGRKCLLGIFRDITERKRAEDILRRANRIINTSPAVAFLWKNVEGWPVEYVSENVERVFGYSANEFITGKVSYLEILHPEDQGKVADEVTRYSEEKDRTDFIHEPYRIIAKGGQVKWIDDRTSILRDGSGTITHYQGIVLDVTERKLAEEEKAKLEEQLHQSQKMESIGRLAGGVAHDFNNLLTAIRGFSDLVYDSLQKNDPMKRDIAEIQKAADSAAALTQQLLAFSRKQIVAPKVMDLNKAVAHSEKMLRRIIGEDIDFVFASGEKIGKVMLDPSQVDQILVNLAVNARDAMPGVGKLTIETQNMTLDEKKCQTCGNPIIGDYVMLALSDTGSGMDSATIRQIFEPFFTTKEKGKGTGLGLSTVHGIVHQNNGHVNVYSELGTGTTFKIYLPIVHDEAETVRHPELPKKTQGTETILLVEDQEIVRKLAIRALASQGYNVIEAQHGGEALIKCEELEGKIDLLLTDVIMPQMGGKQLHERLTQIVPNLKVLYMSGYTENAIAHQGVLDTGTNFIQKPFRPKELAIKVRQVLDS